MLRITAKMIARIQKQKFQQKCKSKNTLVKMQVRMRAKIAARTVQKILLQTIPKIVINFPEPVDWTGSLVIMTQRLE